MGKAHHTLCLDKAILWQKGPTPCPNSLTFSLRLPTTFSDGKDSYVSNLIQLSSGDEEGSMVLPDPAPSSELRMQDDGNSGILRQHHILRDRFRRQEQNFVVFSRKPVRSKSFSPFCPTGS
jgi:hypothetical protein